MGDAQKLEVVRDVTRRDLMKLCGFFCRGCKSSIDPTFDAKSEMNPTLTDGDTTIVFRMGWKGITAWKGAGKVHLDLWRSDAHGDEVVFSKDEFAGETMTVWMYDRMGTIRISEYLVPHFSGAGFRVGGAPNKRMKQQKKRCPQVEEARDRKLLEQYRGIRR